MKYLFMALMLGAVSSCVNGHNPGPLLAPVLVPIAAMRSAAAKASAPRPVEITEGRTIDQAIQLMGNMSEQTLLAEEQAGYWYKKDLNISIPGVIVARQRQILDGKTIETVSYHHYGTGKDAIFYFDITEVIIIPAAPQH